MVLGYRKKFDAGAILEQIAATYLGSKITTTVKGMELNPNVEIATTSTANTLVGSAVDLGLHHTSLDAEALAENAIGSTLGNELSARIPNQPANAEHEVDADVRAPQRATAQPSRHQAHTQHQSAHPATRQRPASATPAYDAKNDPMTLADEVTTFSQLYHQAHSETVTPQSAAATRVERWNNTAKKDWSTRIHDANAQDMQKVATGMDKFSSFLNTTGNIIDKLGGDGSFIHTTAGATSFVKDSVESTHKMTNDLIFGNSTQRIVAGKEYAIYAATTLLPGAVGRFGKPLLEAAPAYLSKISSLWKAAPVKTIELNRFHLAAKNLSEEAQQNIRILRNWAKSKGWVKAPNPQGEPEKWGIKVDGKIEWRLKIKPEVSPRAGSDFPRFDARLNSGKYPTYINPFTAEIGNKTIGTHINLETLNMSLDNKLNNYRRPLP